MPHKKRKAVKWEWSLKVSELMKIYALPGSEYNADFVIMVLNEYFVIMVLYASHW